MEKKEGLEDAQDGNEKRKVKGWEKGRRREGAFERGEEKGGE